MCLTSSWETTAVLSFFIGAADCVSARKKAIRMCAFSSIFLLTAFQDWPLAAPLVRGRMSDSTGFPARRLVLLHARIKGLRDW